MDDYLPHQRYELPTNKWEEKYQGGGEIPEVDAIDWIHQDENDDSYNGHIGSEVQITNCSGNPQLGKVLMCRKGINGESIGNFRTNPFINTQDYKVEFSDGSYNKLTDNQIEEAMFSHIDAEGHHFQLLRKITDYKFNVNAI